MPVHPRGPRGTPLPDTLQSGGARFIPAGAGNTCRRPPSSQYLSGSSPRARGNTPHIRDLAPFSGGSPPRARGTHKSLPTDLARRRFHPRGRGEHEQPFARHVVDLGSSPAGAGNTWARDGRDPDYRGSSRGRGGNTPANTERLFRSTRFIPRGRGEHVEAVLADDRHTCSSPRGRGEHSISGPA